MKWDMPVRPIETGPLTNREIEELDAFPLAEDGLEMALRQACNGLHTFGRFNILATRGLLSGADRKTYARSEVYRS
jgi:hypothetical protein